MNIKYISIKNFKSIRELKDFKLNKINILLGCNGAGKSNLISFFKLINSILDKELQIYCAKYGIDNILHYGLKHSGDISGNIVINQNSYIFELKPNANNSLFFSKEIVGYFADKWHEDNISHGGNLETNIKNTKKGLKWEYPISNIASYTADYLSAFKIYHFHDTSDTAGVKRQSNINDNKFLREDASNLASFLYLLKEKYPENYFKIESLIQLIAPYFDKFVLEPNRLNNETILLEWKEKGNDKYFNAANLSDGTLRMMCLITLLNQPELPPIIIIDEPELGLHPAAIGYLASMIHKASSKTQFIITTQSVNFINYFEPEDIIIVDRKDNQSVFNRLSSDKLKDWLEDYTIGEIWEKNVIGGRP